MSMTGKSTPLAVPAVCQVAAMALWLSASAVLPAAAATAAKLATDNR